MKKALALVLAVLLTFSLVACNKDGGGSGDALEVTWWIGVGEDATYYPSYDENPVVKYLETKEFNGRKIDLKYVTPVAGAELDNFNTLLATEEYTDIMDMAFSNTAVTELLEDDVIYDLTDYVDQYMPNYKALISEYPEIENLVYSNVNGEKRILKLCMIKREITGNFMGFLYRRDWVAKYGKNPKTGEAFTYGYSDPNDKESYYDDVVFPSGETFPVYISDWEWMFEIFDKALADLGITDGYAISEYYKGYNEDGGLFCAFGGGCPLWCLQPDGQMVFNGDSESMKSYLECLNTWYEKGWLDKSFSEHTSDQAYAIDTAKSHSGKVGMWIGRRAETGNLLDNGDKLTSGIMVYGAPQPINDLYGAEETRNQTPYSFYQYNRVGGSQVITKKVSEEDLPTLLTFLDYFYTTEGGLLICLGLNEDQVKETDDPTYKKFGLTSGYTVEQNEDGTPKYIRNPATKEDNNLASAVAGKRMSIGMYDIGFVPALNDSYTVYANDAMKMWDYYLNTGYPSNDIQKGQFSSEESSRYSKVYANVDTYMSSNIPQFISGKLDLNGKDWDNYCTMLNKYGPEKVTAIYQNILGK